MEGITLPKVWDLKGIVSFILSVIGISYANIRMHMVNEMGEKPVAFLEGTFTLVKTLITEGPIAAWEQLKEMAGEMKDALIQAVIDFVKVKVIEQAIIWLVSLFIPGAGIIKAIIGIYDTIVFFIQKAKMILQMIGNFLSSIGEIAAGNIGAAADAMENGLARGLTLAISFLAQLLHLSGITDKIKSVIKKIRDKVDGVLAKIAKWIAQKGKALLAPLMKKVDQAKEWGKEKIEKIKGKVQQAAQSLVDWLGIKKQFKTTEGETHTLFTKKVGGVATVMIASKEEPFEQYINNVDIKSDPKKGKAQAKKDALVQYGKIKAQLKDLEKTEALYGKSPTSSQKKELNDKQEVIREHYSKLVVDINILGIGNSRSDTLV
ncbi:MAG TPA: hypothetical protein VFJ43_10240, partial [Bacteroidia bacterium]|nr:hypothetical protein [Bacteroidia bacterium]